MAFTLEEMRLINAARKARLSPEAQARIKPVKVDVPKVKKSALTTTSKPAIVKKVEWEFVPSYKLARYIAGPVPGVWCKVLRPRVNRGLEKRRHNQAKHQTGRFRAGSSVLYGSR